MVDTWNRTISYIYLILASIFSLSSRISDGQPILLYFFANFGNSQQKETWTERPGGTFSRVQTSVDSSRLHRSFAVINRCWLLDGERWPCAAERDVRRIVVPEARLPLKGSEMGRLIKAALRLMLFMLVSIWSNPTRKCHSCAEGLPKQKGFGLGVFSFVKEMFYMFPLRLFFPHVVRDHDSGGNWDDLRQMSVYCHVVHNLHHY